MPTKSMKKEVPTWRCLYCRGFLSTVFEEVSRHERGCLYGKEDRAKRRRMSGGNKLFNLHYIAQRRTDGILPKPAKVWADKFYYSREDAINAKKAWKQHYHELDSTANIDPIVVRINFGSNDLFGPGNPGEFESNKSNSTAGGKN